MSDEGKDAALATWRLAGDRAFWEAVVREAVDVPCPRAVPGSLGLAALEVCLTCGGLNNHRRVDPRWARALLTYGAREAWRDGYTADRSGRRFW